MNFRAIPHAATSHDMGDHTIVYCPDNTRLHVLSPPAAAVWGFLATGPGRGMVQSLDAVQVGTSLDTDTIVAACDELALAELVEVASDEPKGRGERTRRQAFQRTAALTGAVLTGAFVMSMTADDASGFYIPPEP